MLLTATLVALLWANSPWHGAYEQLWHSALHLRWGMNEASLSLHRLVNEGLMTLFFFLVGLEIQREIRTGALSSARSASVPILAALGGMLVPALVFLAIADSEVRHGWAIPTATDIAFAIGTLTLLGNRVPASARIFLLALAVIDDVGAILVIALFYSSGTYILGVLIALAGIGVTLALRKYGPRSMAGYVLPASIIWFGLHLAGVHPTLTGVILGLLIRTPSDRLEFALHPWVAIGIMPLFALANAGVALDGVSFSSHSGLTLALGVILALLFGKPLGILLSTWLAVRPGLGSLAPGLDWRGASLVGHLGGIGFTMSLFLATIAFDNPVLLATAKAAILLGSALAGLVALIVGRVLFREVT